MGQSADTGLYFVGEAIADLRTNPNDKRALTINLGGSSYFGSIGAANALKNAGAKNVRSYYVGPVSEDLFGGLFKEEFEKNGVGTEYVRTIPHISMLAVISTTGGQNKFDFYGRQKPNTIDNLSIDDIAYDLKEPNQLFCVGSVVMTAPNAREAVTEYITRKNADGHVVYFDPNTRPNIVPDRQEYAQRLLKIAAHASVVRFSEEDVAWTFPEESHDAVAAQYLKAGPSAMIITHGGGGCTVFTNDGKQFVPSEINAGIVFTVGAGDNFNAGVLTALASRGVNKIDEVRRLSAGEWAKICAEANAVAFSHLLRVNGLAKAA